MSTNKRLALTTAIQIASRNRIVDIGTVAEGEDS